QAVDPSTLASLARTGKAARQFEAVMLEDARRAAQKAESLGATGWRVHSVVALASYYLGERQQAHQHAEKAVAELPADVTTWNAFATLSVFAEGRQSAITRAMRT